MKKVQLQPAQVIVPGEFDLHSEQILKIYYHILTNSGGENLPPAIVVRRDPEFTLMTRDQYVKTVQQFPDGTYIRSPFSPGELRKDSHIAMIKEKFAEYEQKHPEATHYLIDGNHRTAAATLARQPLSCLELESDSDLVEVRKMVEQGRLFDFYRKEDSIIELLYSFDHHCLSNIDDVRTIDQRVRELVEKGELPQYMVNNFLKEQKRL